MLGIVIALSDEINDLLKVKFPDNFVHEINGKKFYIFKTLDKSIILTFSGVGKANAAATTALLINNFKINKCLNIGSCGGLVDLNIFDVLLVDRVKYGDVDVTDFGYEINQIPKMPSEYQTDEFLNKVINSVLSVSNYSCKLGICFSCDSFVKKDNINNFNIDYLNINIPIAVDMECCAIAQVCNQMNVKFCAIKVISDNIKNPTTSVEQFKKNINKVSIIIDTLIYNIIQAIIYADS